MKYCAAPGAAAAAMGTPGAGGSHAHSHPDPDLLLSSCWQPAAEHLLDTKLLADDDKLLEPPPCDPDASPPRNNTADLLDSLLGSAAANGNLAELKPLPPFTGYTGHLSINGISGHHFHAIAQRLPEENNNYPTQSGYGSEQNVVSSSTCASAERDATGDVKGFPLDADSDKLFSASSESSDSKVFPGVSADSCVEGHADSPGTKAMFGGGDCAQPKTEMYDISSIEDFAAIIGSAIADTTVPSQVEDPDHNNSRDSWMDLDAWIEGACSQHSEKLITQENLSEFILPHSPQPTPHDFIGKLDFPCKSSHDFASKSQEFLHKNLSSAGSTLQTLLTHGYMPLLQNRLQNGPPVKQEAPSSTSYGMDIISTSSPPGNVVSTTDNILLNGRYMQHHYAIGLKPDGLCSPDHMLGNYPHTTTHTPISKNKRNRSKQKSQQSMQVTNSIAFQNAAELSGLLSKEKPVHRCNVCNRGFLNKSNIKVHLRTHTGEKPFRCEVCAKAFRQKAHLIKHQQIHKRIGRD